MSGYRFCRSDDVSLLVRAYNACWVPAVPGARPITEDDFKRDVRRLQLWTSSCMVAMQDREPIGVLFAAKRDAANWIRCIAVRPDHQRQGHARHLLTSLASKLAILGPPLLLADVPPASTAARALFEGCGYRSRSTLADFVRDAGGSGETPPAADLLVPFGLDDLERHGVPPPAGVLGWQRMPEALRARADEVRGLALISDVRVEAYGLYGDVAPGRELLLLQAAAPDRARAMLGLIVGQLAAGAPGPLRFDRVAEDELSFAWLRDWGFREVARWLRYVAEARPA